MYRLLTSLYEQSRNLAGSLLMIWSCDCHLLWFWNWPEWSLPSNHQSLNFRTRSRSVSVPSTPPLGTHCFHSNRMGFALWFRGVGVHLLLTTWGLVKPFKVGFAILVGPIDLMRILALAVASYYRAEWPLLVVVPSSLRLTWAEAFQQWLPSVSASQINVVLTGKDAVDKLVNIISYDLAVKLIDDIKKQKFHVVIVDESHYLKSRQSKRTKLLLPVLKAATRTLLLSGTPALSRPEELYPQLSALQLKLFSNFSDFALRYCSAFYVSWNRDSNENRN